MRIRKIAFCTLLFALAIFASCSKDDVPVTQSQLTATIYQTENFYQQGNRHIVEMYNKPNTLGDLSYYDQILSGMMQAVTMDSALYSSVFILDLLSDEEYETKEKEQGENFNMYVEMDSTSFAEMLKEELSGDTAATYNGKELYVFTDVSPIMVNTLTALEPELAKKNCPVDVLLVGCDHAIPYIYTLDCNMTDAGYVGGYVIRDLLPELDSVLVIKANETDHRVTQEYEGFVRGVQDATPSDLSPVVFENMVLSDKSNEEGFRQSDSIFRLSYYLAQQNKYDIILPICGFSEFGMQKYSYENPGCFNYITYNPDILQLSPNPKMAIVRHMDAAIQDFILKWSKGSVAPGFYNYTFKDGYSEVKVRSEYKAKADSIINNLKTKL